MYKSIILFILIIFILFYIINSSDNHQNHHRKGIILCMGVQISHFMGVWSSIHLIRNKLNSKLPIEIWMYSFEWESLSIGIQDVLNKLNDNIEMNIKLKMINDNYNNHHNNNNNNNNIEDDLIDIKHSLNTIRNGISVKSDYLHFSTKPLALIQSNFEEIILLDCDTLLFIPPEELFGLSSYLETGTMFLNDKPIDWWPSHYPRYDPQWISKFITEQNKIFHNSNTNNIRIKLKKNDIDIQQHMPCNDEYQSSKGKKGYCTQHRQESSMVIMNKALRKDAMMVLENITENISLYERIYGDKETYWIAHEIADAPYSFSPWAAAHWGPFISNNTCPDKVIIPTIAHYLPSKLDSSLQSSSSPQIMSMNQMILKHLKGMGIVSGDAQMGVSHKLLVEEEKDGYFKAFMDFEECPKNIASFRRYHRCWSRHMACTELTSFQTNIIKEFINLQKEARQLWNQHKTK